MSLGRAAIGRTEGQSCHKGERGMKACARSATRRELWRNIPTLRAGKSLPIVSDCEGRLLCARTGSASD
jgi:hypothetical protein